MSVRQEHWMKLGRLYESPRIPGVFRGGLCNEMSELCGHVEHYGYIYDILRENYDNEDDSWWLPRTQKNDHFRAFFSYLMAAMTDAERDELVVGL